MDEHLTSNEKRRHALVGRARSIEDRAKIRVGMEGIPQGHEDYEFHYRKHFEQIAREDRIKGGLANAATPIVAPEVENKRTQLGQLVRDATTTVTAEYLDPARLLELIEKRYITDETWRQLEEWLGAKHDNDL
jgi:hypothetical protein